MCTTRKAVEFVPLKGTSLGEIEKAASEAVSNGGTVVGFPTVTLSDGVLSTQVPTMAIIRTVPQAAPQPDPTAAADEDEIV